MTGWVHRTLVVSLAVVSGCLPGFRGAPVVEPSQPEAAGLAAERIYVPVADTDTVWERAIDVLHRYHFEIARENRLDGMIETEYRDGSGILEPWHPDSVGLENRLESTFQPIRRRVFVSITPEQNGHLVGVEVFKEIESPPRAVSGSPGSATFQEYAPLQRDLERLIEQPAEDGWIPLGRDPALEQALLASLGAAFSG